MPFADASQPMFFSINHDLLSSNELQNKPLCRLRKHMQKGLKVVTAFPMAKSWIQEIVDLFRRRSMRKIIILY